MNSILKGYLKFIGLITTAIITLYVIYYSIWALCLINDACYSNNFGV
jgi:heme/copper-type cytochrome/quinol oxidase subunit 4